MPVDVRERINQVTQRISVAAHRSGRSPDDIKLVAVSKTHPVEAVRYAISCGLTTFGENKVQEAESKITELGPGRAEWHLIGHLQSNKARRAVQLFDVIQSVHSVELAQRLERICEEEGRTDLPVFVQVDLAKEAAKSGVAEEDLPELSAYLQTCSHLRFRGLMLLPPLAGDPDTARPFFRRLREIRNGLVAEGSFSDGEGELSMGMTHDFEVAIEEGATVVRIGTAIFGERS